MNAVLPQTTTTAHRNIQVLQNTLRAPASLIPNEWDGCLLGDRMDWEYLLSKGGLEVCCPHGRKPYNNKPWISMPAEGRRFKPIGTLAVPNLAVPGNLNVDTTVMQVQVPKGYNGVITDVVCEITSQNATGFVEGSGDLVWRLSADSRYLRDLGNITTTLGSLVSPNPVPRGGLRVYSENILRFTVSFGTGSPGNINAAAIVICSITGWFYPR